MHLREKLTKSKVNMLRKSTADVILSTGLKIPKGTRLGVSAHAQWDPKVYQSPEEFQVDRFVKLSERPGEANKWQLTTLRPEHIAFGHGMHACPGRFLAATEVKMALCHLLLNYDWRLSAGSPSIQLMQNGVMMDSSPMVQADVRSRQPEIRLII
jgi:cytochrome P450